jgi:hypothetical protein
VRRGIYIPTDASQSWLPGCIRDIDFSYLGASRALTSPEKKGKITQRKEKHTHHHENEGVSCTL